MSYNSPQGLVAKALNGPLTHTQSASFVTAGLIVPIGASERLSIEYTLLCACSSTGGVRIQTAALPSGATGRITVQGTTSAITASTILGSTTPATSLGSWNTFNGIGILYVQLYVANSTTAGSIDMQFSPVTNGQTATMHIGSRVVAYKVA